MTDQDYIRKAVELADGWEIDKADDKFANGPSWVFDWRLDEMLPQQLDALAAQLVKQVDELADQGFVIRIYAVESTVLDRHNRDSTLGSSYGIDRTMNTIKAIVDSKVLEAA